MAEYTFSGGLAYSIETIGDDPPIDTVLGVAVNVTAEVFADVAMTEPVEVRDQLGTASVVYAGSNGFFSPFIADDVTGVYLLWGEDLPLQFHPSDQALNSLEAAQEAADSAAAAAAAAAQAAIDAAAARVAAENAALGALTAEERAVLAMFAGIDTSSAEAGWVITWDAVNLQFLLEPVPSPTISADDITEGTLAIERMAPGVAVVVSKSEENYGDADEWPVFRPGDRPHPVIWEGDTEDTDGPGVIMLAGADYRWYTP